MSSRIVILTLIAVVFTTNSCHGYGYGPPAGTCADMFPEGHYANASTEAPPFEIIVNQTSYSPGDVIEIQLNAKTDTKQPDGRDWFYEGAMVQVRSRDCASTSPLGKFKVMASEDFLQPIDCFDLEKSAIRHYSHAHIFKRTFYWTAPSTSSGHVFVRATVARNQAKFWTNVFSQVIRDPSDQTSTTSLKPCPVRTDYRLPDYCPKDTGAASHITQTTAVLLFVGAFLAFIP